MVVWDSDGRIRDATSREMRFLNSLKKTKYAGDVYAKIRAEHISTHGNGGLTITELVASIPEATKEEIARIVGQLDITKVTEHYLKRAEGGMQMFAYKLNIGSGFLYMLDELMGHTNPDELLL